MCDPADEPVARDAPTVHPSAGSGLSAFTRSTSLPSVTVASGIFVFTNGFPTGVIGVLPAVLASTVNVNEAAPS